MAESVLLSDQNLLAEDLGTLAARIKSGEGVKYRVEQVERIAANIERTRKGKAANLPALVLFVAALFALAVTMAMLIRATAR